LYELPDIVVLIVELLTRPPLKSEMGDEGMDTILPKPLAGLGDCGEDIAAGLEIKLGTFRQGARLRFRNKQHLLLSAQYSKSN
jgi:hypothetical protein